ncbi:hypothetical protein [Iamia sp.]|uniref:hypothetical protein n=1 Tax=Iamia sp. TaxID=2722710 RepID=UPI002C499DB1|nr:hypothetical protein [Iamia sp.]HXH58438.1 hypothetical protein [Iamia sp.]
MRAAATPPSTPPLERSVVLDAVMDDLRARRDADGPRGTADGTRGRGSQTHQCARKVALEVGGVRRTVPDNDWSLIAFRIGNQVHDEIQAHLVNLFGARIEVRVSYKPTFDFSGHADAVHDTHPLTGETRENLVTVEIKSMAQYAFDLATGTGRSNVAQGPKVEHVLQAACYANAPQLNSQYLQLVYYGKDKGRIAEWLLDMDEPFAPAGGATPRAMAVAELERLTKIFSLVDQGVVPAPNVPGVGVVDDPSTLNWPCGYCAHRPTCLQLGTGRSTISAADSVATALQPAPAFDATEEQPW